LKSNRRWRVLLLGFSLGTVPAAFPGQAQTLPNRWVGTWATAPDAEPITGTQPKGDKTYREIVHISQGAQQVRVVFSNEFGTTRLTIASAHIAPSNGQSQIDTAKDHQLTFSGNVEAIIPAGSRIVSDAVALDVGALSTLSVSFYVPSQEIPVLSVHQLAMQTNYVVDGNQVTAASLPAAEEITTGPILRTLELQPSTEKHAITCLGDSITDGFHSTVNANARWPNILANRLVDSEGSNAPSVLDLGIGGNRLLQTGVGPDALARLDRDILSQSNVKYLIVLEGINDIGDGWKTGSTDPFPPSADDITAAYQQIITRAHAHNIIVYGGTLLPYEGAPYYSAAGDAIRQQVNQWIRNSGAFDGVLDFEKVVQDPDNPLMLAPAYDSGDHLHPNDAGYQAMGDSISLTLF
jgi:lysophospholipase L1-like esterase